MSAVLEPTVEKAGLSLLTTAKYCGAILTISSLLGGLLGFQRHADAEAERERRHADRIRELQRIIVSEFPAYTAAIDWEEKP